jgi:membrane associated rhomboid family serine protease
MSTETTPYCYRHPDRETHIRCQRCERPICPDCMNQAAVGFQCPSCVHEGSRSQRPVRTAFGGRPSGDPALTSKILIGINVAVWLVITAAGDRAGGWLDRLALYPVGRCRGPQGLWAAGEQQCTSYGYVWVEGVVTGAWWQPLTSMFTHSAMLHIGFNMLALWILGPQLEAAIGRVRFLVLYFLSGLAGSATVLYLTAPYIPTIGASGAVFGLMGALLVVAIRMRAEYSQILFWIGLNVVITVLGGARISWQGHLGGLVGGVLIASVLAYAPRAARQRWQALGLGVIAAVVLAALLVSPLLLGA